MEFILSFEYYFVLVSSLNYFLNTVMYKNNGQFFANANVLIEHCLQTYTIDHTFIYYVTGI